MEFSKNVVLIEISAGMEETSLDSNEADKKSSFDYLISWVLSLFGVGMHPFINLSYHTWQRADWQQSRNPTNNAADGRPSSSGQKNRWLYDSMARFSLGFVSPRKARESFFLGNSTAITQFDGQNPARKPVELGTLEVAPPEVAAIAKMRPKITPSFLMKKNRGERSWKNELVVYIYTYISYISILLYYNMHMICILWIHIHW